MRTSPNPVPAPPLMPSREVPLSIRSAERAYQGSTIAAMLLLLGSLWLFR